MRALLPLAILTALVAPSVLLASASGPAPAGHVFVIVLENKGYDRTFGPGGGSPYLAQTLTSEGTLLTNYYGTGHSSLDNYVAMVSGQPPVIEQQADCPIYHDFVGVVDPLDGVAIGQGCVYPASVLTIGDQLQRAGLTWRQYAEDMAASPANAPTTCRHPQLNTQDPWESGRATDNYATKHVGPMYFHSVIDDVASCAAHNVDLSLLSRDLASEATTPDLALISPNLCSDGHDSACANASQPGGYAGIDAFLRTWIPRIQASPAYQHNGAIVINFDEGDDATACCGETQSPDTLNNGGTTMGMGGGRVGAVLLTPCAIGGSVDARPLDHYGLLRSIEDNFGVARLANAATGDLTVLSLGC